MDAHRDLLSVEFWNAIQAEHRAGHVLDIVPYPPSRRFAHRRDAPAAAERAALLERHG